MGGGEGKSVLVGGGVRTGVEVWGGGGGGRVEVGLVGGWWWGWDERSGGGEGVRGRREGGG